jgi:putative heme-binding domain-containing protein
MRTSGVGLIAGALIVCLLGAGPANSADVAASAPESDADAQAREMIRSAAGRLSRERIAQLLALDEELKSRRDPTALELQTSLLKALAESGTTAAVEYVRGVFESEPERRDEAAFALSRFALEHRRIHGDWQYLVRSLTVVEGDQASSVIAALNEFPERATKPTWIRQIILIGLRLDEPGARDALRLLAHWGDETAPAASDTAVREQLAAWQEWFRQKYPEEAEPAWPADHPGQRWSFPDLLATVEQTDIATRDRAEGAAIFQRAGCSKCHRIGALGEQIGPELTRVATRLQRKQILQEIVYPSLHLNEEYPAATLLLHDGRVLTGTVTSAGPDAVLVGAADGTKSMIEKVDIDESHPRRESTMPAGLLDTLSLPEIQSLMAFLLDPPPV